jgi:3-oxoacyl-[acyl-carrier-protein] synthase II
VTDVVITGAGVISPLAHSVDEHVAGMLAGAVTVAPAPWTRDDLFFWYSAVTGFRPTDWMSAQVAGGTDLFSQWAIAAARQAVSQAGLEGDLPPRRTAVVHGTSIGGARAALRAQYDLDREGIGAVDRKTLIKIWPNMAASQISMMYALHGPQVTITTACASSLDALGHAADLIRAGRVDVAIAGATEGGYALADGTADGDFLPAVVAGQVPYKMTTAVRDRERACLPFDTARSGIVTGEGSAVLLLESAEHARARGATVLGRIAGYATLADAYHPSSPEPSGRWEATAMRDAQAEAGVEPVEVDALFAHGTATPLGDLAEIRAINDVFAGRPDPLPVTSIKGHLGHTGAASGAMALISGLDTFAHGLFPHTAGTRDVEPEADFRVVTEKPLALEASVIQGNSFGFGGQDASLIVVAPEG